MLVKNKDNFLKSKTSAYGYAVLKKGVHSCKLCHWGLNYRKISDARQRFNLLPIALLEMTSTYGSFKETVPVTADYQNDLKSTK